MTKHLRLLAAAILGLGVATTAQAGRIDKIDCNIDAYNLTGRTANDFDIRIGNVSPAQVTAWQGARAFPEVTISADGNDTLIHYFGTEIPHGGAVHIGHEIFPAGPVGTIEQYWSFDGRDIGRPAFGCGQPADVTDGTITNTSATDLWVQRRPLFLEGVIELGDLMVDGTLWTTTPFLDLAPVLVGDGESLAYAFGNQGHGTYLMMYQVCSAADCNATSIQQVVFSAQHYTPEPGSLALMLAAAGGLALRRRRPTTKA